MMNLVELVKKQWVVIVVIVVGVVLWQWQRRPMWVGMNSISTPSVGYVADDGMMAKDAMMIGRGSVGMAESSIMPIVPAPDVPPVMGSDRLVIRDTSLSLFVEDVGETVSKIKSAVEVANGFMVSSYMNTPEGASNGSISVRVPTEKLDEVLDQIRGMAVRVVNESVSGTDVTDQYEDLEARRAILEKTKAKFEGFSGKIWIVCSRSSMDRTSVCGTDNVGSIPTGSTRARS